MRKLLLTALFSATFIGASAATPNFLQHKQTSPSQQQRAPQKADSADEEYLYVGYLGIQPAVYCYDGYSVNEDLEVQAATRLKKSLLTPYVGAKIVKLRFGWSNPDHTGAAHWTLRSTIDGEPLSEGDATFSFNWSDSWDKAGWNVVDLAEPIEITADMEELWIGYTVGLHANEYSIPTLTYGTYEPESQYIQRTDDPGWVDISNDMGPMYMEAMVIDNRTDALPSLAIQRFTTLPIQTIGVAKVGDMWVKNNGAKSISKIKFNYRLGDVSESFEGDISTLKPGSSKQIEVPIFALGTGQHYLSVTALNGTEMENPEEYEYDMVGVPADVAAQYTKKGIVEYFCSENDHNTPRYYEEMIIPGLEGYEDNFILINQHCDDQFMQGDDEATQMLLDFFDGDSAQVYIPAFAIDRSWLPGTEDWSFPTCAIQYTPYPYFAAMLYDIASATPAFASIELEPTFSDDCFTIKVKGNVADGVLPAGENPYLTVYLMEDGIPSSLQELPDDEDWITNHPDAEEYVQNHVIRFQPTPLYGEKLDGAGEYEKTYTGTLNSEWKPENMYAVAMINRGVENGPFARNIINAGKKPLEMTTGITTPRGEAAATLSLINGAVVSSDGSAVELYDLSGRRVANSSLASGVYVAKAGSRAVKVAVK